MSENTRRLKSCLYPANERKRFYHMKVTKHISFVTILAALVLSGCVSQQSTELSVSAQSEENVRMVLHSYVAGRQARDLEAVKAVMDLNVDQLTSRGEWRRGLEAATAGMKRSSKKNPGNRSLKVESVRFLRPDVALADALYTIKGTAGPDRILWSSFTLVKSSDGKWRITSIRNQKPAN
jgi:uncharacterized protein (TIGR02246 family)